MKMGITCQSLKDLRLLVMDPLERGRNPSSVSSVGDGVTDGGNVPCQETDWRRLKGDKPPPQRKETPSSSS